ncbi:MAG TPA: nucleotidyltransferase family protein [Mycobacteriales bacterium]|nr:nucleotidyltransferase family protein [Mycobacteriales bacterium]
MDLVSASVTTQLAAFEEMVLSNPVTTTVMDRLQQLALNDCYLAAGALFQTVWNCLSERDPQTAIKDYDVNYFDDSDLSWDAEDSVIRRAADLFADLDAQIEVRNEARVHLWYEQKFGIPCPPYDSTAAAIRSFPNMSSCFGIRPSTDGIETYAPYGFTDLFAFRMRPNPGLAPRHVYDSKAARWSREWPRLTVLPWPAEAATT